MHKNARTDPERKGRALLNLNQTQYCFLVTKVHSQKCPVKYRLEFHSYLTGRVSVFYRVRSLF
jgi:hypothetical protein